MRDDYFYLLDEEHKMIHYEGARWCDRLPPANMGTRLSRDIARVYLEREGWGYCAACCSYMASKGIDYVVPAAR